MNIQIRFSHFKMDVDFEFRASEDFAGTVRSFSVDGDLTFGHESDERRSLWQIDVSIRDGDVAVLRQWASAWKTGVVNDGAEDAAVDAALGKLGERIADVSVGAGSKHMSFDRDAR